MFKSKNTKSAYTSFFSSQVELKGTISAKSDLRLEGTVEGEVYADNVHIGDSCSVVGKVSSRHLSVDGSVKGDIHTQEKSEIFAKAKIYGDIRTNSITIDKGALIDGAVEIHFPSENKLLEQPTIELTHEPFITKKETKED